MDIHLKRCKYCDKVYHYQASGNGCFRETNDENYCPRCKEIINEALLNKVPKNDILIHIPIKCDKFTDDLLQKMDKIKKEYEEDKRKYFSSAIALGSELDYDNIEKYYIDSKIYYICYNDDNKENKDYFIEKEFCKYDKTVKDIYYDYNRYSKKDSLIYCCNICRRMKKAFSEPFKVSKPCGKLFYNDIIPEWEIINKNN